MKQNRHQKIAELVSRYEIETQEELAEKLKEAGFTVTQATISRDIRQMNLSKLPTGNGRQKYVILKKEKQAGTVHAIYDARGSCLYQGSGTS